MNTLEYIRKKYNLNPTQGQQLIEIPNAGRDSLASLFAELGFTTGAEIGVESGLYSEVLLKANPELTLLSVDAWTPYRGYRDHVTTEKLDRLYAETKERLAPFGERSVIRKGFSEDIGQLQADNFLDFAYIDANHEYQHVVNDIALWHKKVKVGGIIAGHDYIKRRNNRPGFEYLMHVIPAVDGYVKSYNIKPLFILGTKEKKEGQIRDAVRSWFYVKPENQKVAPGWKTT